MINFELFKELFFKRPRYEYDPVIELLTESSNLVQKDKNAVHLYNCSYSVIKTWDEFEKFFAVLNLYNKNGYDIENYKNNIIQDKDLRPEILNGFKDSYLKKDTLDEEEKSILKLFIIRILFNNLSGKEKIKLSNNEEKFIFHY